MYPTGYAAATSDEESKTLTVAAPETNSADADGFSHIIIALNSVATVVGGVSLGLMFKYPGNFWLTFTDVGMTLLSIALLVAAVVLYARVAWQDAKEVSDKAKIGLPVWSALIVLGFVSLTVVEMQPHRRAVVRDGADPTSIAASTAASTTELVKDFDEIDTTAGSLNTNETLLLSKISCTKESIESCRKDYSSTTSTHRWISYRLSSWDVNTLAAWYEDKDPVLIDCSINETTCLRDVDIIKQRILDEQSHLLTYLMYLLIVLILIAVCIFVYIQFFKNA